MAFVCAGCAAMPTLMMREPAESMAKRIDMFPAKEGALEHCGPNAVVL